MPPPPLPPPQPQREYLCVRAPGPLEEADGRLDKPFWDAAEWSDDFVDIEGDLKPGPPLRTRVKMLWDDQNLYIGAEMAEPHVWGTLTERDSVIFHDNDFEVFLNPTGNRLRYYEFEMNALNTVWDLFLPKPYRDGGQADNSWDIAGLRTAVFVDGTVNDASDEDRGWSVEIVMPWAAFDRHPGGGRAPEEGEAWRINFSRVEWDTAIVEGKYQKIPGRAEHNWVWSPMGLIDMHVPERWGIVRFVTE
ncbi:MAG: carbohydrate-binding family 9-like protein [Phycisphaerales bacterium]|nr:carbohydrate-binding family 9-like protein [Phycisphaerales bacterium]